MLLYVYSPNMELLGLVEEIESLIWTRKYWVSGAFKLLVAFDRQKKELLKSGNIIMKQGDVEAVYIQYVHIYKNVEGFEEIEIQGHFLPIWVGKRVIASQLVNVEDTAQNIIGRIVDENCVATAQNRKIPRLSMGAGKVTGGNVITYTSKKYENVLDAIEGIAQSAKIGFRIVTDRATGLHMFECFKGADKTEKNNAGNPPCIFAPEFDNVLGQEFSETIQKYRNTAYIEGEKREDETYISAIFNDENTGLDRNEMFVSGSNIKQTYKNETDTEVTMTDTDYRQALLDRGKEKLESYPISREFASDINAHANLRYRVDFDLGDKVTIINSRWNTRIDAIITEISEIYEANGERLEIQFGEAVPSLYKQIKTISEGG